MMEVRGYELSYTLSYTLMVEVRGYELSYTRNDGGEGI
jgi:hypothetical protein